MSGLIRNDDVTNHSASAPDQIPLGSAAVNDDEGIEVRQIGKPLGKEKTHSVFVEFLVLARDLVFIIALLILFGVFIVQPVAVEGTSMSPQLKDGDKILVDKRIYYKFPKLAEMGLWSELKRGDVITFWYPNDPNKSFVKRLVGLPGEVVEIRAGKVFVNGRQIIEPYLSAENTQSPSEMSATTVKNHYYFVMGDNRDNSSDSRSWGLVPEKYVYGKVLYRYYPFGEAGKIEHGETEFAPNLPDFPVQKTLNEAEDDR